MTDAPADITGNRDPEAIEDPDNFIIDRPRPRQHLSFGFGIHRCVGMRVGVESREILVTEPQRIWERAKDFLTRDELAMGSAPRRTALRILWEEIVQRYPVIEATGPARRVYSNFIHGIRSLPVRISA